MNSEGEPPHKKKETNPSPSLLSFPDDIITNCLACISRSYYPKLSLVCKTFRSLILSMGLSKVRFHLRKTQPVFHVCLKLPNRKRPYWFSLWIKPDETLTNNLKKCSRNIQLVRLPSSYSPRIPLFKVRVGSECYAFRQNQSRSSVMKVLGINEAWLKAPNMIVARKRAVACVLNGKMYVIECCGTNGSANWAEVFDPKTQTWESLPDPGFKISFSNIKTIDVIKEKLYLRSYDEKEHYVYDPKVGKWDVVITKKRWAMCVIKNVRFKCDGKFCFWYDKSTKGLRRVRGLDVLNENRSCRMIEIANYGGKLLILGDKFADDHHGGRGKNIWCAVIALERRDDGEVWGNIEWADVVRKVLSSYVYLRSQVCMI